MVVVYLVRYGLVFDNLGSAVFGVVSEKVSLANEAPASRWDIPLRPNVG